MDRASRRQFIQQTGTLAGGAFAMALRPAAAAGSAQAPSQASKPLSKTQKLRALLRRPGIVMAPEGYTVISAKLAEAHGFEAIYIGGSMMSGTYLGVPDWGLITPTEMVDIAGRIAREITIPAIVDGDHGGETALNVYRTVQQYEKAGIAALHIEDTLNPKHADQRMGSGVAAGRATTPLQSVDRMVVRIRAAVEARTDPDFVIIARSDEPDLDALIRRGNAFAQAGADVFMPRRMTPETVDRIAGAVPIPLLGVNLPLPEVRDTMLKVNVYAGLLSGPATALCDTLLRELKEHGEVSSTPERRVEAEMLTRLRNGATYSHLAERWTATP